MAEKLKRPTSGLDDDGSGIYSLNPDLLPRTQTKAEREIAVKKATDLLKAKINELS